MSGIDVNSTTDIGRHISTLVKTLTTIGSDLEDYQSYPSSSTSPASALSRPSPRSVSFNHRRSQSVGTRSDEMVALRAMELDLARQTRKLQKLRYCMHRIQYTSVL